MLVSSGSASSTLTLANAAANAPWQSASLVFTPVASGNFSFSFANAGRDTLLAAVAGTALILLAAGLG